MSAAPYDPVGEVPITSKLITTRPDLLLNNYKRIVKVGGGQHGTVYLCLQQRKNTTHLAVAMKSVNRVNPKTDRYDLLRRGHLPRSPNGLSVADKVLTTEEKIRKEIAIMKKLRHPHVVRLYEVIDDRMREKIYIVMEYLGGGEVIWHDKDNNPLLTLGQTRRIMRDALLGLEYLHYQGIIHRDIKPANLLYTFGRSHVKIGDFGVSHFSYAQRLAAVGAADPKDQMDPFFLDDSALTLRAGTPIFLAPEVVWEYRITTAKSSPSLCGGQALSQIARSVSIPDRTSAAVTPPPLTPTTNADKCSPPISRIATASSSMGRPQITKAIDVWALGITFYCLLTGNTPYDPSHNEYALFSKIANQTIKLPPTLGVDRVPTGDRKAIDSEKGKERELTKMEGKQKLKDEGQGPIVLTILEGLLQRDPTNRITLEDFKSSNFILTGVPNPEDWLHLTSPTARISVNSNDTSQAMSPLRFRAGWGTRLVRQFSSLWSRGGNATASSPPSLRRRVGPLTIATQVPHLIKSVATSSSKASPSTITTPTTVTSTLQRRRSRLGRSGTVSGATGRHLAASIEGGKPFDSFPLDAVCHHQGQLVLRPQVMDEPAHRQSLHSSPTSEPKSMGWWKRNVAGILTWSPDRYTKQVVDDRRDRDKQLRKEEKDRKRLIKKGSRMVIEEEDLARELSWLSERGLDTEYDPMLTSRTFDSYMSASGNYQPGLHPSCERPRYVGVGLHHDSEESSPDHAHPPTTYRSEEALRTYLPSPASAEDNIFFNNARRASSWGQGDRTEYEVQSITSDAAPPDAQEVSDHIMWRGSEGLYVMDQGILVPVSTTFDEADRNSGSFSAGSRSSSMMAAGGPGPSTARYRATQPPTIVQGNVQRLTPILDDLSSASDHQDARNYGSVAEVDNEEAGDWSEDEDLYNEEEISSDEDHVLTFSPSRRGKDGI